MIECIDKHEPELSGFRSRRTIECVGLLGRKGSGKDTAADALEVKGYYRTSFAKAMREEISEAFGIPVAQLEERALKDTPIVGLSLHVCKDPKFQRLAYDWAKKARATPGVAGWLLNPATNDFMLSPRRVMQLWGTEYRRAENNLYWVNKLESEIAAASGEFSKFVLTDVREPHEVDFVHVSGGRVIKLVRPDNPYTSQSDHSSETLVDTCKFDELIENSGTIEALHAAVLEAVK